MNSRKNFFGGNLLRKKGVAIFITLVSLTLLSIIGFGLVAITTSFSKSSANLPVIQQSYYNARMGVTRALSELRYNYYWATSGSFTLYLSSDDNYSVNVWAPASNDTSDIKTWKVTSVGTHNKATRTVTAWIQSESFATYQYVSNTEIWNGQLLWCTNELAMDGKMHTNGTYNIMDHPTFQDKITAANMSWNGSAWVPYNKDGRVYDPALRRFSQSGWQVDPTKFYRYWTGYGDDSPHGINNYSFAGGSPILQLPQDTSVVKNKANKIYGDPGIPQYVDIALTFNEDGTVLVEYQGPNPENPLETIGLTDTLSTDNLTLFTYGS